MNRIFIDTPEGGWELYTVHVDRPDQISIPAFLTQAGGDADALRTYKLCGYMKHKDGSCDLYYREAT